MYRNTLAKFYTLPKLIVIARAARTKLISMKHLKQFLAVVLALVLLNACKKDDNNGIATEPLNVTLHLQAPDKVTITHYGTLTLTLTELNKNEKVEKVYHNTTTNDFQLSIPAGSYEVRATGTVSYTQSSTTYAGEVVGFMNKLDILTATTYTLPLSLKFASSEDGDFIIEEIYFTGSLTPQGKQYEGDQYIKLYNPTNKVLYADGLLIADSKFLTTSKQKVEPNIIDEAFSVEGIVQIPGNGTQYPVAPGRWIVIADQAINHKENNANSLDLSKADFEIYYEQIKDEDNPKVTNVLNTHSYVAFHNRGYKSYVIARLPQGTTIDSYLANYKYTYKTIFQEGETYKIPNSWILDAVNVSVKGKFQWLLTAPSLDSGWTYCGKKDNDPARYGKSVRRKVLSENNGKPIFKDTNNSTDDFDPDVTPSLKK